MRYAFKEELQKIHKDLLKMGAMIEQSIEDMIKALKDHDKVLAQKIIKRDDEIDELEQSVEAACIILIARQQPLAKDLRMITSVLKIVTDLERIADHCADISGHILQLKKGIDARMLCQIEKMAKHARKIVRDTIDAYVEKDIHKAKLTCEYDDIVDEDLEKIVAQITQKMKEDAGFVEQGISLLMISKYLERMADHATNISEWVIYRVTGEFSPHF